MPFTPHITLRLKETVFIKYIAAKEHNTIKEYFQSSLAELKRIENKASQNLDTANSALINLYDLLVQLVQVSTEIRNAVNDMKMIDAASLYANAMSRIHFYLYALKNIEGVWDYLLTNKSGRLVFYYLISLNLIHFDSVELAHFTHEFIDALEQKGIADDSERLMVGFLRVQFDCIRRGVELSSISVKERDENPYIRAYCLLNNIEGLQSMDDKVHALLPLIEKPLVFSEGSPAFIKQLIQLDYSKLFVVGMGHSTQALAQIDTANKLSQNGYLLVFDSLSNAPAALRWSNHITELVSCVYRVMYNFAMFNDPELLFRRWHTILMFFQVFSYYQMMHVIPVNDARECRLRVSQENLLAHLIATVNLLKLQTKLNGRLLAPQDQERCHMFWAAAKSVFCPDIPVTHSFVEILSANFHTVYAIYLEAGRFAELCDIISAVLEFDESFSTLLHRDYIYYSNILTALNTLRDLPKPPTREQINILFAQIDARRQIFQQAQIDLQVKQEQMKAQFLALQMEPRNFVRKKGQPLKEVDLPAYKQVKLMELRSMRALEESRQIIELLRKELLAEVPEKPLETWAEEEKKAEQIKPVLKQIGVNKASSASSSSTQSFFKPTISTDEDAVYVPRDALPKALWDFADFIYHHTKKELILGGSAATFLYLRKNNPRDYDLMLFDVQQGELLELLHKHDFNAQQVGKKIPIIKVQLGSLSLDINTYSRTDKEPLTKTMESILIQRDFKLSALYVVLALGAKQLEVKGYDRAIRSLNNKVISIVNHKRDLFVQDPVRLFRLVKYCLLLPEYRLDAELQDVLQKTDKRLIFTSYINAPDSASMHRGALSTAMEGLLERFEIAAVLQVMDKLGIFSALWDLDYANIKDSVHLLEPYNIQEPYAKKRAINVFFHMHYTAMHRDINKLNAWPFYPIARCVKREDQGFFNWIEGILLGKSKNQPPTQEAGAWLDFIQNYYLQQNASAEPKCSVK